MRAKMPVDMLKIGLALLERIISNRNKWSKNSNLSLLKHFRINISDIKIERRFDDAISSFSSSKYMIELIVYIVVVLWKCVILKRVLKYPIVMQKFNSLHTFTLPLLYIQSIISCTLNLRMMRWSLLVWVRNEQHGTSSIGLSRDPVQMMTFMGAKFSDRPRGGGLDLASESTALFLSTVQQTYLSHVSGSSVQYHLLLNPSIELITSLEK